MVLTTRSSVVFHWRKMCTEQERKPSVRTWRRQSKNGVPNRNLSPLEGRAKKLATRRKSPLGQGPKRVWVQRGLVAFALASGTRMSNRKKSLDVLLHKGIDAEALLRYGQCFSINRSLVLAWLLYGASHCGAGVVIRTLMCWIFL